MTRSRSLLILLLALCTFPLFARPVLRHHAAGVQDRYIVLFPRDTTPLEAVDGLARSLAGTYGLELLATWPHVRGFAANGPLTAAESLATDPRVDSVEQDLLMRAPFSDTVYTNTAIPGQSLWFLDRLDEEDWNGTTAGRVPDDTYERTPDGVGTVAYLIDMPVWPEHDAVEGRVSTRSADCHKLSPNDPTGCATYDPFDATIPPQTHSSPAAQCKATNEWAFLNNTHGTAVASLVTGAHTGSSRAQVVSVNIVPCETDPKIFQSAILSAINWISADITRRKNAGDNRLAVVNHSGYVYPWDANAPSYTAVARDFVINTSVPYFTSADNFGSDSCMFSPNANAYTPTSRHWSRGIFVVGSTTRHPSTTAYPIAAQDVAHWKQNWYTGADQSKDSMNRGTNLGGCVSGFAPGEGIYAASHGPRGSGGGPTESAYEVKGAGSSWSSPLVAGLALRKLDQYTSQPYYPSLYDWLMGWVLRPDNTYGVTKAPVKGDGHDAYSICYRVSTDPAVLPDPNDWYHLKPDQGCLNGYEQFSMPSPGLTSGAPMITWRP